MIKLKIKYITNIFDIIPGEIYNINIENVGYYNQLRLDLENNDFELFTLSNNLEILDIKKNILLINSIYSIEPNNKKNILSLYKNIERSLNQSDKNKIDMINSSIINLLEDFSQKCDVPMDFNDDLDLNKLLNMYQFSFKNESNSLFNNFITYIKALLENSSYKLIICLNILPYFNDHEVELLKSELNYIGLTLLNINLVNYKVQNIVKTLTIDCDLCEF